MLPVFGDRVSVTFHLILFLGRFGLPSGHLLGAAHLVDHMLYKYFDYLAICNFSYFPFWF